MVLRELTHRLRSGGKTGDTGNDHRPALEHVASGTHAFAHTASPWACTLHVRTIPAAPSMLPEGLHRSRSGCAGTGSAAAPRARNPLLQERWMLRAALALWEQQMPPVQQLPLLSRSGCSAASIIGNHGPRRLFGLPQCYMSKLAAAWKACLWLNR